MYAWSFDGFNIVYRSQPKVIGFLAQDLAVVSVAGARQGSKSSRRCGVGRGKGKNLRGGAGTGRGKREYIS